MGFWVLVPGVGMGGGAQSVSIVGPCWTSGEVYHPGFQQQDVFALGFQEQEAFHPGFKQAEREC